MNVDENAQVLKGQVDNSAILCEHGHLDPSKGGDAKIVYSVSQLVSSFAVIVTKILELSSTFTETYFNTIRRVL